MKSNILNSRISNQIYVTYSIYRRAPSHGHEVYYDTPRWMGSFPAKTIDEAIKELYEMPFWCPKTKKNLNLIGVKASNNRPVKFVKTSWGFTAYCSLTFLAEPPEDKRKKQQNLLVNLEWRDCKNVSAGR
jgi:hypothetical protein